MNRFVASAGVLVMGVAGVSAANVSGLTPQQTTKWWSVSAALRGFYDSNVSATTDAEPSPGLEFEPSFGINLPRDRTLLTAKYIFRLNYYADRPGKQVDQTHQFDGRVNHRFSERYTLNVADSFVYSNEPEVIAGGGVQTGFNRSENTAVRNSVPIDFSARLTRLIGLGIGYRNTFVDYEQDQADLGDPAFVAGSRSALLDRVEQEFHIEGEWYFSESTIAFVGYQYGAFNYTSDDPLTTANDDPGTIRDARAHYGYLGAAHTFTKQLSGIARVGVQAFDYYRLDESADPRTRASDHSDLSPYIDLSGTYAYLPGNSLKFGVKVSHAPTDAVGTDGNITLDQLATVFYASVSHRITPRITGTLFGQYMYSVFNGGDFDGETESFVNLGVTLAYKINENLSATLAYTLDTLTSDLSGRDFDRHRVWGGVLVTY